MNPSIRCANSSATVRTLGTRIQSNGPEANLILQLPNAIEVGHPAPIGRTMSYILLKTVST